MPMNKTALMRDIENRIGEPLDQWLAREYRKKKQVEIAQELGLEQSTVSRWLQKLGIVDSTPRRSRLDEATAIIEDLVLFFAIRTEDGKLTTGNIEPLQRAFEWLGWSDPAEVLK
jgi:transcriptional regulator with XRE-family HTH domain